MLRQNLGGFALFIYSFWACSGTEGEKNQSLKVLCEGAGGLAFFLLTTKKRGACPWFPVPTFTHSFHSWLHVK